MFCKLVDYIVAGDGTYSNIEIAYVGAASSSYSLQIRLRTIQKEHSPSWLQEWKAVHTIHGLKVIKR